MSYRNVDSVGKYLFFLIFQPCMYMYMYFLEKLAQECLYAVVIETLRVTVEGEGFQAEFRDQ